MSFRLYLRCSSSLVNLKLWRNLQSRSKNPSSQSNTSAFTSCCNMKSGMRDTCIRSTSICSMRQHPCSHFKHRWVIWTKSLISSLTHSMRPLRRCVFMWLSPFDRYVCSSKGLELHWLCAKQIGALLAGDVFIASMSAPGGGVGGEEGM